MDLNKDLFRGIISHPGKISRESIRKKYNISEREAGYLWFIKENLETISELFETDEDLIEANVRYKKQTQKMQDMNRIERKAFRESVRVENAVEEYIKSLVRIFDNNKIEYKSKKHEVSDGSVGVIQISDVHFNELIDIVGNKYDFDVASKRLYKLAVKAIDYLHTKEISDVFIFMTGDLMNSDRRLDELVSMSTNRAKATFIAVEVLTNFIMHINEYFNVHVAGVVGNESRVKDDYAWANDLVSDNYDFTIFNILRYNLNNLDGISFLGLSDKHEEVVSVNGKNFLIIHGHQIKKDTVKDISKIEAKYMKKGVKIDFVVWGHVHEAMISDSYARSSSLCGSNNYSEDSLLLVGRASQNIYIVSSLDEIDAIKVDLQDVTGYDGYDTRSWDDAYNPKSIEKAREKTTILEIKI